MSNRVQFMGLIVVIPQLNTFVVPRFDDHMPFLAFKANTARDTDWPIHAGLPLNPLFDYVDLADDRISFPNASGDLIMNSGYLPRLTRCCPNLSSLRDDVPLAAVVHLSNGDVGYYGGPDNTAISTIVDFDSTGYLLVKSQGNKLLTFTSEATIVIGNVIADEAAARKMAKKHFLHYYELFSGGSACTEVPPKGLCAIGATNPNEKPNPPIKPLELSVLDARAVKFAGAEIDCSNSSYP